MFAVMWASVIQVLCRWRCFFCSAGAAGGPVADRPAPEDPREHTESFVGEISHQTQRPLASTTETDCPEPEVTLAQMAAVCTGLVPMLICWNICTAFFTVPNTTDCSHWGSFYKNVLCIARVRYVLCFVLCSFPGWIGLKFLQSLDVTISRPQKALMKRKLFFQHRLVQYLLSRCLISFVLMSYSMIS